MKSQTENHLFQDDEEGVDLIHKTIEINAEAADPLLSAQDKDFSAVIDGNEEGPLQKVQEISIEVLSRENSSWVINNAREKRGRGTDISMEQSSLRHISFKEFQSLKSSQRTLNQRNDSSPSLQQGAVTLVNFKDKLTLPSHEDLHQTQSQLMPLGDQSEVVSP